MAQFLRPDSNVTQTSFTGGFAEIDESTASDADFAYGANNTAAVLEVGLSNPAATPDSAGTSTVRYRIAKTNNGTVDGGGNAVTVTGAVYQGGTLIQSDSARTTSGTWTGFSFTFTHGSITDWTDVRLRFTTSASAGAPAARRGGAVSWAEIEAPDAAPTAYTLPVDAGTFTLTGNDAALLRTYNNAVDAGTYALTGNDANLLRGYRAITDAGTYVVTGNDAALLRGYRAITDAGSYVLTGNPATLSVSGALNNYTLSVDKGTFILTGNDAALLRGHRVIADLGKFFLPERNLRLWSESFDNAYWTKTNSSITANSTTAPDGTLTADTLIENTANSTHAINRNTLFTAGVKYTSSLYVKAYLGRDVALLLGTTAAFGGASNTAAVFSLSTNTFLSVQNSPEAYGSEDVGNGWHRIYITKTAVTTVTASSQIQLRIGVTNTYTGDGTSGLYVWGAQLEEGDLTDYDPAGPSAATRFNGLYGRVMPVDAGVFTLTGNAATLTIGGSLNNYNLPVDAGTFALTGNAATLLHEQVLLPAAGSFAVTGGEPALLRTYYLSGGAGEFIETGQSITFRRTWLLDGNSGQFLLTGNSASLQTTGSYEILPTAGIFTVTGNPANLAAARQFEVELGAYSFTGNNAAFAVNRQLAATSGGYVITGNPATFATTGSFALTAGLGDFDLTGNPTSITADRLIGASPGNYSLTGNAATLTKISGFGLAVEAGIFNVTGSPAALKAFRLVEPTVGSYIVNGNEATLRKRGLRRRNVFIF